MAVVYKSPHEQSFAAAQDELTAILQEREDLTQRLEWINNRVKQLEAYLEAIRPLIENDPGRVAVEAGLTNVCRDLLSKNGRWMSAGEVRLLLVGMGVDISTYTNPMAVLHSVLKRVGQAYRDPSNGNLLYGPKDIPLPLTSPESSVLNSYRSGNLMTLAGLNRDSGEMIRRLRNKTMPPPECPPPPELTNPEKEQKRKK
ncbi:MAG TPA: hypothetical protein VNX70_04570 [Bryobacteraceae bacterium]|jgi:hypothetical protein|nr:hypothetical protein [Bryobacteraceae bacterium]